MFNTIAPKSGNAISPVVTGASFASVGSEIRQSRSVEAEVMPTLTVPKASSESMEWALSGRLGDFLGWTGKKLADIGSELFAAPSIAERRRSMQANRRALLQVLSDMMLEESTNVKGSLPLLRAYLRDVLVLLQSDHFSSRRLKRELSQLLIEAERVKQVEMVLILSEWLDGLNKMTPSKEVSNSQQVEGKRELRSGFSSTIDVSTLTGVDGFTVSGSGANTGLGFSVHKLGDINGDKYDDFIVGGEPGANVAHIIFGSPTTFTALSNGLWDLSTMTLTGSNGFKVKGESTISNDWFGISVSGGGDINGDGYDDVLIGAPYALNAVGPGRAYVIFGASTFPAILDLSTAPLTGSNGFTISGANTYDFFGFSVSDAGDVNGDGYDDIIVGAIYAPGGTTADPGQASVIFGAPSFPALLDLSTTPLTGSNGFTISGANSGDAFGSSVSGAGDIDQDGKDDVIIGAPQAGAFIGEASVIFGASAFSATLDLSSTTLSGTNGFTVAGLTSIQGQLGYAVSGAGDMNQDGFADIVVGAPGIPAGAPDASHAYVIFGAPKATFAALTGAVVDPAHLTGPNGFTIQESTAYDQLGFSVSEAGDINGDSYDDIIVGAPGYDAGANTGQAYVIYGSSTSTFSLLPNAVLDVDTLTTTTGITIKTLASDDKLGYSVGAAGDVNGDGIADIIVGAPFVDTTTYTDAGQAHVLFGIDTSSHSTAGGLAIDVNGLKIKQGKRVLITTSQLSASLAGANADSLLFTVSYGGQHGGSIHGYFEYGSNQGTPIYQFTQADIEANLVNFVHDGEEYAPNYAINVCHGDASLPVQVKFHFSGSSRRDVEQREVLGFIDDNHVVQQFVSGSIAVEDLSKQSKPVEQMALEDSIKEKEKVGTAPSATSSEQKVGTVLSPKVASSGSLSITNHDIELKRDGKHRVRLSELSATGGSVSDDALKFTVLNNYRRHEHGYFKDISQLGEVRQFTQADIRAGSIYFIHDKTHDKPNYAVSVSDGECTIPETVAVDFYNRHGKLIYSGRPAGASQVRSDEGLAPEVERQSIIVEGSRADRPSDARLLSQGGFFGEKRTRGHRPRAMTMNPQKGAERDEIAAVEAISPPAKAFAA